MKLDPIVAEIHEIRKALSRASGDDIRKIAEAAKARQTESGAKPVRHLRRKPRAIRQVS